MPQVDISIVFFVLHFFIITYIITYILFLFAYNFFCVTQKFSFKIEQSILFLTKIYRLRLRFVKQIFEFQIQNKL